MNSHSGIQSSEQALSAYKTVLQKVLENRPSGMRQRLAKAIGKNPSFISQIANPNYNTPIPFRHLGTIFDICHFSVEERETFEAAYRLAHPGRIKAAPHAHRMVSFRVPDLGSARKNADFDAAMQEMITRLTNLVKS